MTKEQVERFVNLSELLPRLEAHGVRPSGLKKEYMELGNIVYGEWRNNPEQFEKNLKEWGFSV